MVINIFYYRALERLKPGLFEYYLQFLPSDIQKKITRFKYREDAERSLSGNILLIRGLKLMGKTEYSLNDLQYSTFQKPFLDDVINFNISHSGQYTVCAISETSKVGIDVEEIREIPLIDFDNLFSKDEWDGVKNSKDVLPAFYTLWTKKEAFLKAIGSGLNTPLSEVNIMDNNRIPWQNADWFLHEVNLDSTHISYLCTDSVFPVIHLYSMDLNSTL